MLRTTKEIEVTCWASVLGKHAPRVTIPAGTRVAIVDDPMGLAYAVDDVPLLPMLTGNSHDPVYRYVYLPTIAKEHTR